MRALALLIMTALAACTSTGQPPGVPAGAPAEGTSTDGALPTEAAPSSSAEPAAPEAAPPEPVAAETVELTRGKRVDVHGLRVMLRGTSTENRSASQSANRAELEVRRGDEERIVSLEREQPGDPKFVEVFELQLALESVDASHKPSTAQILVRP